MLKIKTIIYFILFSYKVDPSKRPEGSEIIDWLEKIYRNLQNDIVTQQEKEKTGMLCFWFFGGHYKTANF